MAVINEETGGRELVTRDQRHRCLFRFRGSVSALEMATSVLSAAQSRGRSLSQEPWWVIAAATTFTVVEWFSVPPPVAILAELGW